MSKIPVIMDVDTGVDDSIAILCALASEELDIKAICAVNGNQTLEKTYPNTLKVLEYFGRDDIPVGKGAAKPLRRPVRTAGGVHGDSGLGNAELPEPTLKGSDLSAVELMAKIISESSEPITLIPVGPLTNIAVFLMDYPQLKKNIKEITIMGGVAFQKTTRPAVEFNIAIDPEAAHIVFESGIPIKMVGLDVTYEALVYKEDVETIKAIGNRASKFFTDVYEFYFNSYTKHLPGCPLHDALAVCSVIEPDILKTELCRVDIELTGDHTTGATVCDLRMPGRRVEENKNCNVALEVNRERFMEMVIDSIKKMG